MKQTKNEFILKLRINFIELCWKNQIYLRASNAHNAKKNIIKKRHEKWFDQK